MSKVSIAIVSSLVGKTADSSVYSFVFDEASELSKRGLNVHVIRSKAEKVSISQGISFHGLKRRIDLQACGLAFRNFFAHFDLMFPRSPIMTYFENLYALNVSNVVKENRANLIHAHFAYPEGLVGLLAKEATGKPLVVTVHGYDIVAEPSIGYGARLNKKLDHIIREVLDEADAVIAASQVAFSEAQKMVSRPERIHLIPNGVDTNRFNQSLDGTAIRKKLGIKNQTVVFTLRSHEPKYGLEYLIRAASIVTSKTDNVVFVLGGEGSMRCHHQQLVTQLRLENKVLFTGKIPQSEVPSYYSMGDIVVVPSLQEAFGLVVSEAMACGKPVVGTNVGGIPDQLIDGFNGFIVPPKNAEEIAEKILWLVNNPEAAKRMGAHGRDVVERKFDIRQRISRIENLYREILNA
jgi:L-malate glycosyltransferase